MTNRDLMPSLGGVALAGTQSAASVVTSQVGSLSGVPIDDDPAASLVDIVGVGALIEYDRVVFRCRRRTRIHADRCRPVTGA